MDLSSLNRLRNEAKAVWNTDNQSPRPLAYIVRDEARTPIINAGKTIASELGLRFIEADLAHGIDQDLQKALARPGDRLVLARNLGLHPPENIEGVLRAGRRTLILIEVMLSQNAETSQAA